MDFTLPWHLYCLLPRRSTSCLGQTGSLSMKPKLYYVNSTRFSITLKWEVDDGTNNMVYRIDVKDVAYKWITKYWGIQTHCEIKGLGPETLYYFRLAVSTEQGDEVYSNILTTATKDDVPMLFYMFKSAERNDLKNLESFFKERKDSAALDAFDKKGETALIRAVERNNFSIVRRLLTAGARVDQGGYGTKRTPLMYACFMGHLEIAKVLLESGANSNSSDCNDCGPLHYATDWNQLALVKICLESGADINKKDVIGWTPLMRAVIHRCKEEIVMELLLNKPDIETKDKYGKTALDLAKLDGNSVIYEIILDYKAKHSNDLKEGQNDQEPKIKENEEIIQPSEDAYGDIVQEDKFESSSVENIDNKINQREEVITQIQ